jgi:molybdenum cofactor biosynthesis enzyme MoaA
MKNTIKKILPNSLYTRLRKQYVEINDNFEKKTKYGFIAVDTTANCNLRCPFCLNDFSDVNGNRLMTEENFRKVLQLLPLVYSNNFYTSCLFEPFLHAHFIDYLEKIPEKYRKKIFFTTNLTARITDEQFDRLSRLNLSYINISLDSFQPGVFEKIRKGAKFNRFKDNLDRMAKIFEENGSTVPIRYITVVTKDNVDEIPALVETCHRKYRSSYNEIRFIYSVSHLSLEWKKENLISNRQWEQLEAYSANTPYNTIILPPPSVYYPEDNQPYSRKPGSGETFDVNPDMHCPPFGLNIDAAGTVTLFGTEGITFDLNSIDNPYSFFKKKKRVLKKQYLNLVKAKSVE